MKSNSKTFRGFSGKQGSVGQFATVMLATDQLILRQSGKQTALPYEDIEFVTVSWLGTVQFRVANEPYARREESLWFFTPLAPHLLTVLTNKNILAGGHVARRLLVSQLMVNLILFSLVVLLFSAILMINPSTRHDSIFATQGDFLKLAVLFSALFSIINVWRYFTGSYSNPSDKFQDWFPW